MQKEFLLQLSEKNPDAIIVGSIGTISYDLKEIPHKNKILIKGAMGAAISCGLGVALSTDKQVIVVIGDGSLLMHLGSMANVEKYKLPNLRIIVIQNDCYKSCGGQKNNFQYVKKYIPFDIIKV